LRTQRLQDWTHVHVVPVVPALRTHDRLHVRDTFHRLAVAVGPIEAEGRAPVMDDEGDALVHIEGLEQGVEVAAVLDEAIRAGAAVGQLVGVAHADQVGGDAAAWWLQVRQHVAPEIRRGGIAVQQHDGVALSHLHVRHLAAEDPPPLLLVRKCRPVGRCQGHRHAHEGTPFRLEEPRSTKNDALRATSAFAARRLRTEWSRGLSRERVPSWHAASFWRYTFGLWRLGRPLCAVRCSPLRKRSIAHASGRHDQRWQSRSTLVYATCDYGKGFETADLRAAKQLQLG